MCYFFLEVHKKMNVFLLLILSNLKHNKVIIAAITLILINILLIIHYVDLKTGFHIDELYSYAHSNSTQGAFLSEHIDSFFLDTNKDLQNKWISGKEFHDYLTVQKDEQFRYSHIWDNMANDVHPPFYYILLHTVCSFFPDEFNKWHGISLNIILWVLTLYMTFKFSCLFFSDKKIAFTVPLLYAFSRIGLDTVIYTRMYLLQTLLAISLLYETFLLLNKNQINKRNIFLIFLYSFLGIFTHYNAIVFSFFIAGATCCILLFRKNWKLLLIYSCSMLLSLIFLFIIFPSASNALFNSARSEDFNYIIWKLPIFIKTFTVLYISALSLLLNIPLVVLKFVFPIIFLLYLIIKNKHITQDKLIIFLFSIISIMGMWLVYYMPNMNQFIYRYFMLLFPSITILFCYIIYSILTFFNIKNNVIFIIFAFLSFVNLITTDYSKNSPYSFQNDEITNNFISFAKDKKIFMSTPFIWMTFEHINYFKDTEKVYVSLDACDFEMKKQMIKNRDAIYLYFSKDGSDCINCYPSQIAPMCNEMKQDLIYVYTVRIGERFYDVYKIR